MRLFFQIRMVGLMDNNNKNNNDNDNESVNNIPTDSMTQLKTALSLGRRLMDFSGRKTRIMRRILTASIASRPTFDYENNKSFINIFTPTICEVELLL